MMIFCSCLPPYIIHQGKRLYDTWCPKNGFAGTRYNVTESGWVDENVFFDWFTNQFIPSVKSIKRPIILFFDGHTAHISTRIIKTAMDHQIELECIPPHSSTILQPLDVVTLTKVKTAWRHLLNQHNVKSNSAPIDKPKFALMVITKCPSIIKLIKLFQIRELWCDHLKKSHCQGGFAKAGIYPFDPKAISKEKLLDQPVIAPASVTTSSSVIQPAVKPRIVRSSSCIQLSELC